MSLTFAPRKKNLCDLLRNTGSAFVQETSVRPEEDASLRSELDCLLALWAAGAIDPVHAFMQHTGSPASMLSPEKEIPYR